MNEFNDIEMHGIMITIVLKYFFFYRSYSNKCKTIKNYIL